MTKHAMFSCSWKKYYIPRWKNFCGIQTAPLQPLCTALNNYLCCLHTASPAWENIALSGAVLSSNGVRENAVPLSPFLIVYSNPFNGTTTIDIGGTGNTQAASLLKIYDLLGSEVADLSKEASGANRVMFDASGMPAGIYLPSSARRHVHGKDDNVDQVRREVSGCLPRRI